jgi:hypothetical protein
MKGWWLSTATRCCSQRPPKRMTSARTHTRLPYIKRPCTNTAQKHLREPSFRLFRCRPYIHTSDTTRPRTPIPGYHWLFKRAEDDFFFSRTDIRLGPWPSAAVLAAVCYVRILRSARSEAFDGAADRETSSRESESSPRPITRRRLPSCASTLSPCGFFM